MNSKSASVQRGGSTFSNLEFDFGISSNRSRSLNDLKNPNNSNNFSANSSSLPFQSTDVRPAPASTRNPNRPSWTHQAAPSKSNHSGLSNAPTTMAGDIFGKSWAAASSSSSSSSSSGGIIGIANKNPNLFGDLVNSALGHGRGSDNVPIRSAVHVASSTSTGSSYSMGSLADSLPKGGGSVKTNCSRESPIGYVDFSNLSNISSSTKTNPNLGGSFVPGFGVQSDGKKQDPFESLLNFESKQSFLSEAPKVNKINNNDDIFGDFHNCSSVKSDSGLRSRGENIHSVDFMDDYNSTSKNPSPSGGDVGMMFASSVSAGAPAVIPGLDEWESDSKLEGEFSNEGSTTELNGISPPPLGISVSNALSKGMNHHKQGQYADAIKWLSWALSLPKKASEKEMINDILSCRASCYKEVGEYKKAIADCTEVLGNDKDNVGVLVKRALLYESLEKYRLGAQDLRTVMKLDPSNKVARSTIHRLTQLS